MSELIFDLNTGEIAYVEQNITDCDIIKGILEQKKIEKQIDEEVIFPSQRTIISTKYQNAKKYEKGLVQKLAKKRREIMGNTTTITTIVSDYRKDISIQTKISNQEGNSSIWEEISKERERKEKEIETERKRIVNEINEKKEQEEEKRMIELQRKKEQEEKENREAAAKALIEMSQSIKNDPSEKNTIDNEILEVIFEEKKPKELTRIRKRKFDNRKDINQMKENSEERRERITTNSNPTKTARKTKRSQEAAKYAKIQLKSGIITPFSKFAVSWEQYNGNREFFDEINNVSY